MNQLTLDLSIFNKLNLKQPPVGVKFLYRQPDGINRLGKKLALCEMVKEAQQSKSAFYIDLENQECVPANYVLGYDIPKEFETGLFGAAMQVFKDPRANIGIYKYISRMREGTAKYIVFSPINTLIFDPDLLIILTDDVSQTEIIFRAMGYTSGQMWNSKMTNVLGCSWLFAYPYVSGEVNYMTTGLSFGMKSRKVFPPGLQLISIPFNWLPVITQNLKDMPWELPAYTQGAAAVQKVFKELGLG